MDDKIFDQIQQVDLKKTMESSYIDYAMSVIASRALPDVRDGLKPVQRRVLYSMVELGNTPDKPHRKCARIVGDTMGKYHPHGDSSIYGALVNMAQDWSMRYTLVDGHGNFGSVDGDGAAAMRYTEARLSKISLELIKDIGKNTVDFEPNFDETEKEPIVLPSRYPNLLVNGTTGIAVGMATNIPPHNLREVVNAVVRLIDNDIEEKETTIDELIDVVKGPDFPTGGIILGTSGIKEAYRTGRGKIRVRAVTNIEPMENGKNRIVVTELPYNVNKARLIEKIAELHKDKKIDGITDLRDETSREGMRIVVELRRDVNPSVVLNLLFKHTQLQDTFGVIEVNKVPVLAIPENVPFEDLSEAKNIAFATSFNQRDLVAFDEFMEIIKPYNAHIHLFNISTSKNEWNEIRLTGVNEYFKKQYPQAHITHTVLADGDLLLAIEKFVRDEHIDVIALSTYRRNILARMFNPSIARKMLFHTDTPLLVMHA